MFDIQMIRNNKILKLIALSQIIHLILPYLVSTFVTPHSNQHLLHGHSWFLNFDGVHYFYNQYRYQQNFAFFPFYVTAIQVSKAVFGESLTLGIFILLNRCLFILCTFEIYHILSIFSKQKDTKLAEMGTIIFLFNPASIFFHVLYTESLFCFVTCKAIRNSLQGKNEWVSVLYLSFGVCLRSNGLFLSPIVGLQILFQFVIKIKERRIISLSLMLKGLAMLAIIIWPFIFHLVFSYLKLCKWGQNNLQICQTAFPNIYSYVQQKYWSVGFFKYFKLQNLLFIIIGTPALTVSGMGLLTLYDKNWNFKQKGLYLSYLILFIMILAFTNIQSSTRFFSTHPFFYYLLAKLGKKWRIIRLWVVIYYFIGIFLYTSAFPWT